MYTENFNLDAGNGQQWARDGMFRCIRYDEGAATGGVTPKIRITSVVGSAYDCELIPGRQITLPENARGIVVKNASGAASINGKITVGSGNISDNSIVGEVSLSAGALEALEQINVRPEASSGSYALNGSIAANTWQTVFSPAANVNGAILLSAQLCYFDNATVGTDVFIAKASTPSNVIDGEIMLASLWQGNGTAAQGNAATLPKEQFITAGLGLYFMSNRAWTVGQNAMRTCRYKLL